jgi:hypothetical protein
LLELHAYLENAYWPSTIETFLAKFAKKELNAMMMIGKEELNRISDDEDILALYCQILAKRLFIIDDKEFLGTKQALMGKFLSIDQIKFAAFTLNRVAF